MKRYLASLWESVLDGVIDIGSHKTRTLLQAVGIVLGVASVVATAGLIDGGKKRMEDFFDKTGGVRKLYVGNKDTRGLTMSAAQKKSKGLTYEDAAWLIREAKTLELVEPIMERQEQVRRLDFDKRLNIQGTSPAYEAMYDFHAAEGRFLTADDLAQSNKVVVLGSTRREEIFGGRPAVGSTLTIAGSAYTVVGVMERKEFYFRNTHNGLEWMNRQIFIPITTMINRLSGDRQTQRIAYMNLLVRERGLMNEAEGEITRILTRAHGGVADFEIQNRAERMRQQEEQGRIYDITFLVCGAISLLVGGIVIMNILLASFNERVREVGTRKAIGATGLNIMAQFLVESVVVTILGGLLGVALGAGFTQVMSSLIDQPVVLTMKNAVTGLSFAVAVGIFFGFYPAIKAARLNPIEALRYE
ncbi:MAG: ABC transporter permease [Vicinamibacteria bacterium]|nr:ABC transporter permease [Vicinamibacteria bacterium]